MTKTSWNKTYLISKRNINNVVYTWKFVSKTKFLINNARNDGHTLLLNIFQCHSLFIALYLILNIQCKNKPKEANSTETFQLLSPSPHDNHCQEEDADSFRLCQCTYWAFIERKKSYHAYYSILCHISLFILLKAAYYFIMYKYIIHLTIPFWWASGLLTLGGCKCLMNPSQGIGGAIESQPLLYLFNKVKLLPIMFS